VLGEVGGAGRIDLRHAHGLDDRAPRHHAGIRQFLDIGTGIPDDRDPHGLVARPVDALAPGSYLVVTQLASDLHREGMRALSQSAPDQALQLRRSHA
jgi:S-adenosyl methyltransferase